jgi:DNA-directed RNA polymerase II subunit RPB2
MEDLELRKITRSLLEKYVRENNILVRHQIDSFDDFVLHKLEHIICGFNPIDINEQYLPDRAMYRHKIVINIENPTFTRPTITEKDGTQKIMMPNDARLRNMTYSSLLTVDVNVTAKVLNLETNEYQEDSNRLTGVSLGKIPIMVRSRYCNLRQQGVPSRHDECRFDYGGYFVINGNEKVVIAQDRIAENKVFVFVNNKATPYSHIAEVRSVSERRFGIPKTTAVKLSNRGNQFGKYIRANVHHMKHEIPLFILFRALGIESDKEIVAHIVPDCDDHIVKELAGSMDEASSVRTKNDAIVYLMRFIYSGNKYVPKVQPPAPPKPPPVIGDDGIEIEVEVEEKKVTHARPAANKYDVVMHLLEHELFPHIGTDLYLKAVYLGYMVKKLLRCYMGEWPLDDRDSYVNKRIDTPGILIANLFRQYYAKTVKDMRNLILKDVIKWPWRATTKLINVVTKNNVYKLIKSTVVESGLKYGLATGNWGVKSSRQRQGVAQVLNRMTYLSTLSHLRRINTPIEKTGKLVQPRKLHPTQWGVICPSETPEGASVGLVKNLAMTTTISIASNALHVRNLLNDLNIQTFDAGLRANLDDLKAYMKHTFVFVNGAIVGIHYDPPSLYHALKRAKRAGRIHVHTGIVWNIFSNEIVICTEGGRCCRPLYIIGGDGKSTRINAELAATIMKPSGVAAKDTVMWAQLVLGRWRADEEDKLRQNERLSIDRANGIMEIMEEPDESIIEYMDVEETNCAMIAMSPSAAKLTDNRYTHMEMDPSLMLGAIAGTIPFSDHNQAPRNTYQAAMGKQAISVYASNFRHRYDTVGHILNYPQRPLVSTQMAALLHGNDLPSGINAIVAIATYTGFNQEDSVIMNHSAVERGLFVSTVFKTYREQNNKNHSTGEEEFFCKPDDKTSALKPYNYDKLHHDGFVPENSFVDAGDIIIGKCMPQKFGNSITNKDTSVVLKNNERGYIDRNCHSDNYFTNVNGDGYTFAKVRVRQERSPTIGDKFSSRSGQKGTMGMSYRAEDMPFTAEGLVPDIIINPHAIPSRMTIGQLMECILGTACVEYGAFGDATPFTGTTVEDIGDLLQKAGHSRMGNHVLYNSRTGEQITTTVFMGPTYYQRLKHMVADKMHSRSSNGPVVLLTRQPAEGRARDGGLRLGEMEIECQWSHGMLHFLKERFMECSDNYRVFTCRKCGMMAVCNPEKGIYSCTACKNITSIAEVRLPYACKLLLQEIHTMGIGAKFLTD